MADQHLIVAARRLRDDLRELKRDLRHSYKKPSQQVTSERLRENASGLAETWIAGLSQHPEIVSNVSKEYVGDLNVHFQRILVGAEKATIRKKYDFEIDAVLETYTTELLVPLMQGNAQPVAAPAAAKAEPDPHEAFAPT